VGAVDGVVAGGRAEELGEGGLVKLLKRFTLFTGAVLSVPTIMTTTICNWKFAWNWNRDGQCAATDQPSEVFLSFLALSGIASVIILLVWVLFWLLTKFLQHKVAK
jgi:hypothetical protein